MKFYKIQIDGTIKYYKNLKKLCLSESLNYTNVYYKINRTKIGFWTAEGTKVEKCIFQN